MPATVISVGVLEDARQQSPRIRIIEPAFCRIVTLMKICGIYNDLLYNVHRNGLSRRSFTIRGVFHLLYCIGMCLILFVNAIRVFYEIHDERNGSLAAAFFSTVSNAVLYTLCSYVAVASLWTFSAEFKSFVDGLLTYEFKYGLVYNTRRRVKKIFKFAFPFCLGCAVCSTAIFIIIIARSNKNLPAITSLLSLKLFGIEDMKNISFKMVWLFVVSLIICLNNFISISAYCLFMYIMYAEIKAIGDNLNNTKNTRSHSSGYVRQAKSQLEELLNIIGAFDSCMRHYIASMYVETLTITCLTIYTNVLGTVSAEESINAFGFLGLLIFCISIITLAAVLLSRKIHEPLNVLHQLDMSRLSEKDMQEISIFMSRLSGQSIGISVYGLFVLDQSSILAILGTLLTYTIVMVQFKPAQDAGLENGALLNLILSKVNHTEMRLQKIINGSLEHSV